MPTLLSMKLSMRVSNIFCKRALERILGKSPYLGEGRVNFRGGFENQKQKTNPRLYL